MTIATIIKFEVLLMDTRTENVIVNNLLKQTGTIYRIILHLPFIVDYIFPAGKYEGTCREE